MNQLSDHHHSLTPRMSAGVKLGLKANPGLKLRHFSFVYRVPRDILATVSNSQPSVLILKVQAILLSKVKNIHLPHS